jgi:SNF2 family DNA or RNA helicase
VQLKPFQIEGAKFLAERTRALLADEPGVGKTPQLITACQLVDARNVLVLCPDIAVEHWLREFKKWGRPSSTLTVYSWDRAHELRAEMEERFKGEIVWDVLIPDEAHFGKNPLARRTQAVFGTEGLGWHAKRIWAASGTPAPNSVAELWPLLRAFNKTPMDQESFTNYFCRVDQNGKVRGNRPDHIDELRAILKSFSLRRLKKDVLPELGAIDIQEWYIEPSGDFISALDGNVVVLPEQERALRKALAGKSDEDLLIFLAGDQEFSTLRRYNALLKAPAVFETVKFELANGLLDKVVIFGHHREALQALHEAFWRSNITSALIFGDTPRANRDYLIEDWKKHGRVLIASTIIASTALDFTAAHQGIALELDWVPGVNSQAFQRMHRHGQQNPVTVRVAIGTPIDEIVSDVLLRKTRDLAEIFD